VLPPREELGKAMRSITSEAARCTEARAGESLGTPFYMSPEQMQGKPCDRRGDFYSLGIVFFELLTASGHFNGESTTAICMAHLSSALRRVTDFDPDVSCVFDEGI
jgi:eukaryotic-like serine/threonine-protein kinase